MFYPKVSVVIPVYNGANYLKEAIDSALAQTYRNFEVIVINDGSSDNGATERIAKSYGNKIRYFYKKNGGISTALNYGIKKMRGQYFSWLSHDDVYYPNKIQVQIDFLKKLKNKNAVLYSDFDLIDSSSKMFRSIKINPVPPEEFQYALIIGSPVSGCTTLVPKMIFNKIGLFKENLKTVQDYDMWFRIAKKYDFIHISKSLIKSRIHPQQGMQLLASVVLNEANRLFIDQLKKISQIRQISKEELPILLYLYLALGLTEKLYFTAAEYAFGLFRKEIKKDYTPTIKIKASLLATKFFYLQIKFRLIFRAQRIKKYLTNISFGKNIPKKKRLLLITPGFPPLHGGLAEQSYLLAQEFRNRGWEVDVLAEQLKPNLKKFEVLGDLNIYRLNHLKKRNVLGLLKLSFGLLFFILKNRSKYNLCIIRTVTSQALIIGILKFFHIFNAKTFITAETGDRDSEIISLKKRRFWRIIVFFLSKNDFINSNNFYHFRHYKELGFPKNKLTKIHNGINVSNYQESSYPLKINSFLFLAELNKEKGIYELLNAFEKVIKIFPDKKLYIGGYGKEEEGIKKFIKIHHLKNNIFFLGLIKKEEKKSFFQRGNCLVFPSYSEGFGIVTAEAISFKKLLISTRVAGLEKIYGNQIVFCNKKDIEDLYQKIIYTIKTYNPNNLNYDSIIKKIDIKTTVNQIEGLST